MPIQNIRNAAAAITWTALVFLVMVLVAPSHARAQTDADRIVVFGDSLSDSGNGFALTRENSTPPDYGLDPFLVPGDAYARGGHHLSNGATWIEQLARPVGLARTVRPAFLANGPGTNYAIGIARARQTGSGIDLPAQIGAFLQDAGGAVPSGALYVLAIGGNDVRDAMGVFGVGGQAAAQAVIDAAVASIRESVVQLHAMGARTFLIWNVPDVSLTPAVRLLDTLIPGSAALGAGLSLYFNFTLGDALAELSVLPGIQIIPFDVYQLLHAIVANPTAFGLTDVTNACVTPGLPPFACTNPDEFLFWDGIHPTRRTHAIVAETAADALGW